MGTRVPRRRFRIIHAIAWTVVAIVGTLGVIGAFSLALANILIHADFGSAEEIVHRNDQGVILYDRHDRPFFTFYDAKYKQYASLDDVSDWVEKAVIAAEDEDFYRHGGYSLKAIARAAFENAQAGGVVSGGSTITQQLVKNTYLSPAKTYTRKLEELLLARKLEQRFSKQEILEMHLNTAYFGEGAYGIGTAAQAYFSKPARDLTLAESSLLVGILPAPSSYSPVTGNRDHAIARQHEVLDRMVDEGVITNEDREAAKNEAVHLNEAGKTHLYVSRAPHFAFMVLDELKQKYSESELEKSGFHVKTTLDLDWQSHAEDAVRNQVNALAGRGVTNGGAVAIVPSSGEIRALVGSKEWENGEWGKYNVATAKRQPGSSFKPIIFAAALDRRTINAAMLVHDQPVRYLAFRGAEPYVPRNYDNKFRGPVSVRRALANSLNVPAVEVLNGLGLDPAIETAKAFGYSTLDDRSRFGLSLALGAGEVTLLEHTQAFAALANEGELVRAHTIAEVKDKFDRTTYAPETDRRRAVSREASFILSSILSDEQARQEVFGRSLNLSRPAAAKTGTTQDYHDAWTMGYTPDMAVGVWIGNNSNRSMDSVAGALGAAPIWKSLMERFHEGVEARWYAKPDGVEAVKVCRSNGLPADFEGGDVYEEYFLTGTVPDGRCNRPAPPRPAEEEQPEEEQHEESNDEPTTQLASEERTTEEKPKKEPEQSPPPAIGGGDLEQPSEEEPERIPLRERRERERQEQ